MSEFGCDLKSCGIDTCGDGLACDCICHKVEAPAPSKPTAPTAMRYWQCPRDESHALECVGKAQRMRCKICEIPAFLDYSPMEREYHRRGLEIIHWKEIAGGHLCRAEALEVQNAELKREYRRLLGLSDIDSHTHNKRAEAAESRAADLEAQNAELEQWKREALEVMKEWDGVTKFLQDHFEVTDWGKTWQAAVIRRLTVAADLESEVKWMKQHIKQIEELAGQYRDDAVDECKRATDLAAKLEEVGRTLPKFDGIVRTHLHREMVAPANHEEFRREAREKLDEWSALLSRLESTTPQPNTEKGGVDD